MGFTATSIASFARRAAADRATAFGQPIHFRGQTISACVEPVSIGFDLQPGGPLPTGSWTVRIPHAALTGPAPARGETIRYGNRNYIIETTSADASPAAAEHIITIIPGSAI